MICYPKVAIDQRYCFDQWTHFMASFKGFYNFGKKFFKVKKCGIRLIYPKIFSSLIVLSYSKLNKLPRNLHDLVENQSKWKRVQSI